MAKRWHPDNTEGIAQLEAQLEAARVESWLDGVVASAPPLTQEQAARLAGLLFRDAVIR
ncbi:hypothetical protein [Kribbella sp. NPDC004536]|uniref:hypothetical protein n=1 Tax=Kribbella sp. NPDC004536 TaxID=3364106 RepID=UPI0036B34BBD